VSLDPAQMKRRRNVMMAANTIAALAAIGAMTLYVKGETWAIAAFVAAVLAGFGVQIWFIAGLRRGKGDV
jgi:hypothetical protein